MDENKNGAVLAPKDGSRIERQVGPETRAVRIFREVFAQDAQAARHLRQSLDRYLKVVLQDPDAKRGDKTYARKIYADLLRQFGTGEPQALPDWAKKLEEPALSDQDIQEILRAADAPSAPANPIADAVALADPDFTFIASTDYSMPVRRVTVTTPFVVAPGMDIDPLDDLLESTHEPHPIKGYCQNYLYELMRTNELPFVRVFQVTPTDLFGLRAQPVDGPGGVTWKLPEGVPGPGRYVALGTVLGTVTHGKHQGKKVNIHCTVAGYRRLRDAEKHHFVYLDGKPMSMSADDPKTGLRKHIFCLRHTSGLKIRYWTRINEKDEADKAKFFVLTADPLGVREITRNQF